MTEAGQRRWYVVRGSADETTLRVHTALAAVTSEIIWVSATAPRSSVAGRVTLVEPRALGGQLGRSAAVVVLDHHGGFDAEVLGQAHGLVRGGGALISRLPPAGTEPDPAGLAHLCAHPYGPADVGRRFAGLVEAALARWGRALPEHVVVEPWTTQGSDEQRALVVALAVSWRSAESSRSVLTADRGRGKSSALGLALGEAGIDDAIVTAAGEEAV
ncbi:MAG: DUF1726 domain-containing protein, partial [Myxococcales bacterium]|nr:DUF1726 domain-containing protein [Myxococcales bacterium]